MQLCRLRKKFMEVKSFTTQETKNGKSKPSREKGTNGKSMSQKEQMENVIQPEVRSVQTYVKEFQKGKFTLSSERVKKEMKPNHSCMSCIRAFRILCEWLYMPKQLIFILKHDTKTLKNGCSKGCIINKKWQIYYTKL